MKQFFLMKQAILFFAFLFAGYALQAQVIYITPNGAGNQSGSNWSNAAPGTQLQDKINGAASGSQVWVAGGTYQPPGGTAYYLKEGVKIYGGFAGTEPLLSYRNLSIAANSSILKGNGASVIYNNNSGLTTATTLDGFTITNGSNDTGGGINLLNSVAFFASSPSIVNCTFTNNSGTFTGGIFIRGCSPSIYNCIFTNNHGDGSAICAQAGDYGVIVQPHIVNCSFFGNFSDYGGVIEANFGNPVLSNCIIWENSGGSAAIVFGGSITINNSIVQGGYGGTGNINTDPLFLNPSNGNLRLKSNSPAINKGDNAANNTAIDLDGNNRIYGSTIDMGAYEFQCDPTVISNQLQNNAICKGGTTAFTASASGPGQLSYNWYRDNLLLAIHSATLTITNAQPSDSGYYTADIINSCGTATSNAAKLVVDVLSQIVKQPADTAVCKEKPVTFSVQATGSNLTYQWQKNGVNINGATSNTYSIAYASLSDSGSYTVLISNACTILTSSPAHLNVNNCPPTIHYVKEGGTGDGLSWATASGNLQGMIDSSGRGDEVWVAGGTYKPSATSDRNASFSIPIRVKVYGGFAGTETGLAERSLSEINRSILSGDIGLAGDASDNSYTVLTFSGVDTLTSLDGFVVTQASWGGIYIYGDPVISNCIITKNSSPSYGGGVITNSQYYTVDNPTFVNCSFTNNTAHEGGAVYIGYSDNESTTSFINCSFSQNQASEGGAIYNEDYGLANHVNLNNCIVWNNAGGGLTSVSDFYNSYNAYNSDIDNGNYNGSYNINQDPLFVDAVNGDLHLQACSPVINAGNNGSNATDKDLDGNSRVVGNTIDMGAYEFQGQTGQASIINMPQPVTVCSGTQVKFSVTATGAGLSFQWQKNGVDINGATDSVYSIASANASDTGNYKVVVSGVCGSPATSESAHLTVNTVPAPVVTVADNCGSSLLSIIATGSLLWSTGETTPSITVNSANTYTVTQTVNGCTSSAGSATANPKTIPAAPTVTVADNCGSSTLSTSATGTLLWSTGETTPSVTVNHAGTYTVTQTVNGCTSTQGSGTTAPKTIPAAPAVTVTNNCGSAALSTSAAGSLLWSTGETTPSITVSNAGNYTVKQTVNGCTSDAGSGTAAPKTIPATPVINVTNSCGSSTLSTNATGSLLWSNGATTPSIAVNTAGTYTVTQTVNGCTSTAGSATAAPKTPPATPVVTVTNGCGSSTLSIPSGGSILWSTGATTPSITINKAGTYTVTRTVNGCTSAPGSGTAAPTKGILITVNNISVFVTVKNCGSPVTFGSNVTVTGNTTPPVYKIGNTVITSPHTFPIGTTIVTVIASNSCSNANATFLVIVNDNQAPVITCKPGATKTTSGSTYTVAGKEFDATATDNCGTPSLAYSLSGATSAAYKSTNTTLSGIKLKTGTTTITWKATDASGNATTCSTVVKVSKSCSVNARSTEQTTDKIIAPEEAGASDALIMSVYPNPATTSATLSLSSVNNDVKVSLADLSGRILWKAERITDRNIKIPVANLANGTYLVLVQDKTQTKTLKLIKAE